MPASARDRTGAGPARRQVLVVAAAAVDPARLRASIGEIVPPAASVLVVSPASRLSRLQWLANEEDDARVEAERIARVAGEAVEPEAKSVETEAGDTDPIQAAKDALHRYAADEILVLVRPEDESSWLERAAVEEGFERFGLPVRYVRVRE